MNGSKNPKRYIQRLNDHEAEVWRQIYALMEHVNERTRHVSALISSASVPLMVGDTPIDVWAAIVARFSVINTVRELRRELERAARTARATRKRNRKGGR